jgi:3,4-dihydroxy 2-butanone 4-phosphate synthase / GTP cyclohydrolase II
MTSDYQPIKNLSSQNDLAVEQTQQIIEQTKKARKPIGDVIPVCEGHQTSNLTIVRQGVGILQTKYGRFWQYFFTIHDFWQQYHVLFKGDLDQDLMPKLAHPQSLLMRIDSGCLTGQVFGDQTCDCKQQLELAKQMIQEQGEGLIIHIPTQDGRGMGIAMKLGTLSLQDQLGMNTVESALALNPDDKIDRRTYGGVIAILKFLGIDTNTTISLATNNPKKLSIFSENNYQVKAISVIIPPTEKTLAHLKAKEEFFQHQLFLKKVS